MPRRPGRAWRGASALETEIIRHLHATVEVRDKRSLQHMTRVARYAEEDRQAPRPRSRRDRDPRRRRVAARHRKSGDPRPHLFPQQPARAGRTRPRQAPRQAGYDILKGSISPVLAAGRDHRGGAPRTLRRHRLPGRGAAAKTSRCSPASSRSPTCSRPSPRTVRSARACRSTSASRRSSRHRGSHFDPRIADAFKVALPEIPRSAQRRSRPAHGSRVARPGGRRSS